MKDKNCHECGINLLERFGDGVIDKTAAWIRNEKTEKVHYYCMDCAARCFGLRRYSRSKWKDCY
jgi:hypothetical protein